MVATRPTSSPKERASARGGTVSGVAEDDEGVEDDDEEDDDDEAAASTSFNDVAPSPRSKGTFRRSVTGS